MNAKFLNTLVFGLLLNLLFTFFVNAAPIDLTGVRADQILKVSEELDPHFRTIQRSLKKPSHRSVGEDLAALRVMAKYGLIECANTIWARYKLDLASPVSMRSPELREFAGDALLSMITEEDNQLFLDIVHTEELLRKIAENNEEHAVYVIMVADELKLLRSRIESKPSAAALPTFDLLRDAPRQSRMAAIQALDYFGEILKKRIKGQDAVIEALTALEWDSRFTNDADRTPDVIWLMGSPGTGKDTTAEAFTDALNGVEGAYKTHMYCMPIMRHEGDLWKVLGSATGYKGSEQFPPLFDFLVSHSGGKYLLEKGSGGTAIKENPDWKGQPLPGFARPDTAVIFINEFHNWSKEIKDVLVKEALENGTFHLNNPAGGVKSIEVPVRFVIASNDGIGLVTSRESNGQRYGKSLDFPAMHAKWEKVHMDKKRLKAEIMAGNGASRNPGGGSVTGISEELLNRIQDPYILLMEPLAPEILQDIATTSLTKLASRMVAASALNPGLVIEWGENVAEFIQSYDYNAEDNARPMKGKLKALIVEPLIRFLRENKVDSVQPLKLEIKIKKNEDGTSSLEMAVSEQAGLFLGSFEEAIRLTEKDKVKAVVSDEVIDQLSKLSTRIKDRVFGADIIADRISERVLALANQTAASQKSARNASTIVLMGLSSTGKTELAKAVTEALTGDEKNALVIDFSQVQTLQEFKARILGLRDAYGNPIPSDFMMHYDRLDGDVVVIFDELSNVRDPDLLKALYDFFREPILSTFSDGKERNMSQVKVIVTGNSGIELYKNVPRYVAMEQQMMAWAQISKDLASNTELQRSVLEKSFPEPLINRWGMNNIFFVPPHTYKSLKQLAVLKLRLMLQDLKPADGRRGWDVGFASKAELETFIHMLIERAFNLREQGASIDSFIKDDIKAMIEAKLLLAKTASGSKVLLKSVPGNKFQILTVDHRFAGEIVFKPAVNPDFKRLSPTKVAQVLTAFHEVGHALGQKILMEGLSEPDMISIVPGITQINSEYIAYAGIARHKFNEMSRGTREWYIRQIAILAAGETAERLATEDNVHADGKSNDMMRATTMAEAAILIFGLSDTWGTEAVPQGVLLRDYVASFSDTKKRKFEAEVKNMIDEGRQMAREVLAKNWDKVVVPLALELARKGTLHREEMAPYFAPALQLDEAWKPASSWSFKKLADFVTGRSKRREGILRSTEYMPESVAVIEDIIEAAKQKQYAEVEIPESKFLFLDAQDYEGVSSDGVTSEGVPSVGLTPEASACENLLKGA